MRSGCAARANDLREGTPIAVADGILVPDLVFVVVVPDRDDAVVEQRGLNAVPPPGAPVGIREVDVEAQAVPELRDRRLTRRAVHDEDPLLHRLMQAGMVVQKAGLEIGDRLHAGLLQPRHGACRVGKLVAVPVERVAARADRGVAGAEMEAVAGNLVVPALLDVVRDPRIGVRRVRDGHRGGGEAERPFRREGLTAGQPGKAPHHIRHAAAPR